MGFRSFTDSDGVEWRAWDIVPRFAERRAQERRVARAAFELERRRTVERRQLRSERPAPGRGLGAGWLCFEALLEKRRLAPVPPDWLACGIARLEEYLRAAVPAPHAAAGMAATYPYRRTG